MVKEAGQGAEQRSRWTSLTPSVTRDAQTSLLRMRPGRVGADRDGNRASGPTGPAYAGIVPDGACGERERLSRAVAWRRPAGAAGLSRR